jgi:hypothetical protein
MAIQDEIAAIYQSELARAPDAAGLNYWSDVIASGQATLADVRNAIASSPEAFVVDQYSASLNRAPETAGREYWTGLLGSGGATQADVSSAIRASQEAQGLLGDRVAPPVVALPPTTVAPATQGISRDQAVSLITGAYRNYFDRAPDQAGLDYWANLLTSGEETWSEVLANIQRSAEAQTPGSQAAQAGIRQVQFGQQPIMGQVRDVANYGAQQNLPPSIQNAFQQSLAYQAALPWMIPQFNPADIPATYQQIAQPRQRLDISNITVPEWLRSAASKDYERMDRVADTTPAASAITSTTPGQVPFVQPPVVQQPVVQPPVVQQPVVQQPGGSSNDAAQFQQILNQSYDMAFGRAPDTAGAAYWTNLYNTGTPLNAITNAIFNSPEAQARSGGGGGLLA